MLSLVKVIWSKVKDSKIFWASVVGITLFGGGFFLGSNQGVPVQIKEKLVDDTVTKQKLQEANQIITTLQQQLVVAQKTITELKSNTKTVVRIVKTKDGTTTIDRTTETKVETKTDTNTNTTVTTDAGTVTTNTKTTETETKTHKEIEKIATPLLRDTIYLGVTAQVGITGIANPGLEFKYRLLDLKKVSGWVGTEVIVPSTFNVLETQLRLSVGVSF